MIQGNVIQKKFSNFPQFVCEILDAVIKQEQCQSTQQYFVHRRMLKEELQLKLKTAIGSDISIKVGEDVGNVIKCHKVILAAQSDFFRKLISTQVGGNSTKQGFKKKKEKNQFSCS